MYKSHMWAEKQATFYSQDLRKQDINLVQLLHFTVSPLPLVLLLQ